MFRRYAILVTGAVLMAAGAAAWAQAPQAAGRFVSVTGDVGVVGRDGVRRNAERGGDIREGDTIITGDSALAQARMSDGGLISIRADSEFKLEQFAYKGREDRNASFVVNILKGGFRTITGLISQVNRSGYKITTPAATIGVRGTHFEVVHVLPQIASQQLPAGTYNRVFEGITTVQNPGGALLQVVRDQTAFASLQGGNPVLIAPPAVIFGRPTPVPRAAAPQGDDRSHKEAAIKGEDRGFKMGDRAFKAPASRTPLEAPTTLRSVPLSPIETTTIQVAPTTTTILQSPTISPTLERATTTVLEPVKTPTTTLSPTTSTILQSPTTSTILQSPTTSTILQSPTTTTLSPATTTTIIQQPTTTPILQSPTTILQSPTTTTTTTIKQPTTTTISPTLTR
jgi:hypothetical protein